MLGKFSVVFLMNNIMSGYGEQSEEEENYKQELGLKKMLYKYEHENEQLKSQIRALRNRLTQILENQDKAKKQEQQKEEHQLVTYQQKLIKQEMAQLFDQIQKVSMEIKSTKETMNDAKEQECIELQNQIRREETDIMLCKNRIKQYQEINQTGDAPKSLKASQLRTQNVTGKLRELVEELEHLKKTNKEMKKTKELNDRNDIKEQDKLIGLGHKKRALQRPPLPTINVEPESPRKRKGVWHLEYTQQNYQMIKAELNKLKVVKEQMLIQLEEQNNGLENKLNKLETEYQEVMKSVELDKLQGPTYDKKSPRTNIKLVEERIAKVGSANNSSLARSIALGPNDYLPTNDKNYVPKKIRFIEWGSNARNAIEWDDQRLKSPINGINLWMDGFLVGIQFLHTFGESVQHMHLLNKKVMPIQYRLHDGDWLTNVVLYHIDNRILALDFHSKNGRNDTFGTKAKAKKFDFQIKKPEKPLYSLGRFKISKQNVSEIIKLDFAVL